MKPPSLTLAALEAVLARSGARLTAWCNGGLWSAEIAWTSWIRDSKAGGPASAQPVRVAGKGASLAAALIEAFAKFNAYGTIKEKLAP